MTEAQDWGHPCSPTTDLQSPGEPTGTTAESEVLQGAEDLGALYIGGAGVEQSCARTSGVPQASQALFGSDQNVAMKE